MRTLHVLVKSVELGSIFKLDQILLPLQLVDNVKSVDLILCVKVMVPSKANSGFHSATGHGYVGAQYFIKQ